MGLAVKSIVSIVSVIVIKPTALVMVTLKVTTESSFVGVPGSGDRRQPGAGPGCLPRCGDHRQSSDVTDSGKPGPRAALPACPIGRSDPGRGR